MVSVKAVQQMLTFCCMLNIVIGEKKIIKIELLPLRNFQSNESHRIQTVATRELYV